jgi:hypothetical protein
MLGEFKSFKWADKVISGLYDPHKLCAWSSEFLQDAIYARIYACVDDENFLREVADKIKNTPKNLSASNNKRLIDRYQELCKTPSNEAFQSLIKQHKNQLEQLFKLDNEYNAAYEQLNKKTVRFYSSQHPLNINEKENDLTHRKKSWWANVRYHFDKPAPLLSKSMLISTGLAMSIPVMILGGIVLIATLGTFMFPLSIAFFALGCVLGVVGAITALVDKYQAESAFKKFLQEKEEAIKEIKQIKRDLLEIAFAMQKINFESVAPDQYPSPIASPSTSSDLGKAFETGLNIVGAITLSIYHESVAPDPHPRPIASPPKISRP